jgi:hypothetical protein
MHTYIHTYIHAYTYTQTHLTHTHTHTDVFGVPITWLRVDKNGFQEALITPRGAPSPASTALVGHNPTALPNDATSVGGLSKGATSFGDSASADAPSTTTEHRTAGVEDDAGQTSAGADNAGIAGVGNAGIAGTPAGQITAENPATNAGGIITSTRKRSSGTGSLTAAANSDPESLQQKTAGLQQHTDSWYMCSTGRHFWPCKVGGATPTRIRQVRRRVIERRLGKDNDNGAWVDDVLAELRPPQGDFIGDFI